MARPTARRHPDGTPVAVTVSADAPASRRRRHGLRGVVVGTWGDSGIPADGWILEVRFTDRGITEPVADDRLRLHLATVR